MKQTRLTLAGGGWVLMLTFLFCMGLIAWAVAPAIMRNIHRPPGDGKTIESYQFDLSNLLVPRSEIAAAMLHRDMVPELKNPTATGPNTVAATSDAAETEKSRWKSMQRRNDPKYGKYLVSSDRVIGVAINGEARAYPISVMNVHEIINDTLAETPIAVTYNWPSDSVVVFDRRVNGTALEFVVSGLVYNSNLLMYVRSAVSGSAGSDRVSFQMGGESLFSQLQARAISGPAAAAGTKLDILPVSVTTWGLWHQLHPNTTVLNRDLALAERYKGGAPTEYLNSDKLLFPVSPMPPASPDSPKAKTQALIVSVGGTRRVYTIPFIITNAYAQPVAAGAFGEWTDTLGNSTVRFLCDRNSQTAWVDVASNENSLDVIYAYWFAWHATHPKDELATDRQPQQ